MKVLLARKYLSNNPFTKYKPENISEKWFIYHEDFQKMKEVKQKLRKNGYSVTIIEGKVVEDGL